ncbi:MAG: FAD-dependent oxidoreductase, partial [Alphaproteobacteria bacterium]|nr:FAD-dependent oxidoreductase [Alphaproteobacteria bacterium]
ATLALRAPVEGGEIEEDRFIVHVGGEAPMTLSCKILINAAGFNAQFVAKGFSGLPETSIPPRHLAKGNYFSLSGPQPFKSLVYPVPEPGGLGVHATLDLGGQVRFGPDVEWVENVDYAVDPERGKRFYEAIRRYWPGLPDDSLRPDFSGIRSKISPPGADAADFVVQGKDAHGTPNLVNLYGIESPGLTSSLALGNACLEKVISS